MKRKRHTKLVHEGQYVAEVEVELIETDEGWSPYLSLEDAYKLDDVRAVLLSGRSKECSAPIARVQPDPSECVSLIGEHPDGAAITAARLTRNVTRLCRAEPKP
jgi:hypothetical protein